MLKNAIAFFSALAGILTASTATAASHFDPQNTAALLGSGFNRLSSEVKGDCVRRDVPLTTILPTGTNPDGQGVEYQASEITSVSKFREVTNISASASFHYGIYGGGGSFNLFDDQSMDSFSSYMYVSVKVTNATQVLSQKLLTPEASAAWSRGPSDLAAMCGDEFVTALTTGGYFSAIVRFETTSAEHQKQVSAAINGSIAGFGSASGSFSQSLATLNQLAKSTIIIIRKGGNDPIPAIADLNAYALSFPSRVSDHGGHPYPFDAITMDIDSVGNKPTNTAPEIFEQQRVFLEGLATLRDAALIKRNDLSYAIANPTQFSATDVERAQSDYSSQNAFLGKLVAEASDCRLHPQTNCSGAYPSEPKVATPTRVASQAGPILAQAETLFSKRGDMRLVEATLGLLSSVDMTSATPDERYHTELLKSEALLWRLYPSGGTALTPDQSKNVIAELHRSISRATGLASVLPNRPCEADYLEIKLNLMPSSSVSQNDLQNDINDLSKLRNRFTRSGSQCTTYDWNGIDANSAWAKVLLSEKLGGAAPAILKAEAAKEAKAAFDVAPEWAYNMYVYAVAYDFKGVCPAVYAAMANPTPANLLPLEPVLSEYRKTLGFFLAMGFLTRNVQDCPKQPLASPL